MTEFKIKRAYEPAAEADGFRVYIDRLWPQGLSHETFHYDLWDKDIAPSTELRKWFHEDSSANWAEFVKRYEAELKQSAAFKQLENILFSKPVVTLLYSSHDTEHNNAVVVYNMLMARENQAGLQ